MRLAGNMGCSVPLSAAAFAHLKKAAYESESGFSVCASSSISLPPRSWTCPFSTADMNTLPRSYSGVSLLITTLLHANPRASA